MNTVGVLESLSKVGEFPCFHPLFDLKGHASSFSLLFYEMASSEHRSVIEQLVKLG